MNFPVAIHKEPRSDYGVTVPDLPGCFSAGQTMDEALALAKEAIELHVESLVDDGVPVPVPTPIERLRARREFAGAAWGVVSVDLADLRVRAKRINVTLPERTLDAIDRYAKRHGQTRSGLLARAAADFIGPMPRAAKRAKKPSGKPASRRKKAA
ncbi:MAG: type II toxin-antitoxin system HicB family antitoxin [Phycisphaerales bacterium]